MNRTGNLERPIGVAKNLPWVTFVFLTGIFLVNADWHASQALVAGYQLSVTELAALIDEGSSVRRVGFVALGMWGLGALYLRPRPRLERSHGIVGGLLLCFLVWSFLSVAWSTSPAMCIRRLVVFALFWISAIATSRIISLRDIRVWVSLSALVYVNVGLVAELTLGTFRPLSLDYRFCGTSVPNTQAVSCALLLIAAVCLPGRDVMTQTLRIVVVLESLVLLLLTKSRTSIGAAFFTVMAVQFLTSRPWRRMAALSVGGMLTSLALMFADTVSPLVQRIAGLGRADSELSTLTGRTSIWDQALPYISDRPVTGYGYGSFWTTGHLVEFAARQRWAVPDAHSAYLDMWLALGIVGVTLFVLVMTGGIVRSIVYHKVSMEPEYVFLGGVLIFVAVAGMSESIVFKDTHITFVTMLVLGRLAFRGRPGGEPRGPNDRGGLPTTLRHRQFVRDPTWAGV